MLSAKSTRRTDIGQTATARREELWTYRRSRSPSPRQYVAQGVVGSRAEARGLNRLPAVRSEDFAVSEHPQTPVEHIKQSLLSNTYVRKVLSL